MNVVNQAYESLKGAVLDQEGKYPHDPRFVGQDIYGRGVEIVKHNTLLNGIIVGLGLAKLESSSIRERVWGDSGSVFFAEIVGGQIFWIRKNAPRSESRVTRTYTKTGNLALVDRWNAATLSLKESRNSQDQKAIARYIVGLVTPK